ncbi:prolipoprotein diacylglyceryl transferase [Pseudactinotalea sp. HY158]|nr:prolipoprotein diacylglyceryl transferase [Pseudactinotalea sp. HY158]
MTQLVPMAGIPSPTQGVWHLGPVPIRAYAIAILAGIALGAWIAIRRYRARGGPENTVVDAMFWAVPAGIIGARLYHVFSSPDAYFGPDGDLVRALYIWEGGLGIWGAIPAGGLAAWLFLRHRGLRLDTFADALAPGILVAQAVGRLGNYFNQELFGSPTTLPWGLQISDGTLAAQGLDFPPGTLFHPTFLYELLWNLAAAGVLVWLDRRFRLGHGRVFWSYVALYTLGRGWIETLRIDQAEHVLGLRLNVWTAILVFAFAVTMVVVIGRRHRGRELGPYLPGREPDTVGEEAPDPGEEAPDPGEPVTGAEDEATGAEEPAAPPERARDRNESGL